MCSSILLGTLSPAQEQALWDYGFNLGVAFQLVDDLLDYTADETVLGKPVGGDLREGKLTLPVITLLRRAGDEARAIVDEAVQAQNITPDAWRRLMALLREHTALEEATDLAREYAFRAKQQLHAFEPSREREALTGLVDYVLARDR